MRSLFQFAMFGITPLLLIGFASTARGEVVSGVVGHNTVVCPGGSDTIVSIPFHRPASFCSFVAGSPVVSANTATISHQSERTFSVDQFVTEKHYLIFSGTGTRAGRVYPISSNDANSITIELDGDNLAGVGNGDAFDVIPYWTLSSLFPSASQNTVHLSTGKLAPARKTRILFFDDVGEGIQLAPDRSYFLTAEGWFSADSGYPAADDVAIPPGKAFVIRHPNGTATTTFIPKNLVFGDVFSSPIRRSQAGSQDTALALVRPVPLKLSELDIAGLFTDSSSNAPGDRDDELLVYDNIATALNKQPSAIYFRVGGQWRRDDGASYPSANDVEIPASTGIVIRKANGGSGTTLHWLNTPLY